MVQDVIAQHGLALVLGQHGLFEYDYSDIHNIHLMGSLLISAKLTMHYRKYILMLLVLGSCIPAGANRTTKITSQDFNLSIMAGLLEGEKGSAFQLQTVNGVQYKGWFTGIGIGLDYYRIRSVPVFVDLRKNFGSLRKSFFAYLDGGIHYPWITDDQKDFNGGVYSNGFYSDIGFGYRITLQGNTSVLLSLGYSYKKTVEKGTPLVSCPFYGPCYSGPQQIVYNLNRISFKLGFIF